MKYHMLTKIIAVLLAVLCGACAIMSGIVLFVNLNWNFYSSSPQERQEENIRYHGEYYADTLIWNALCEQSGMPREVWEENFGYYDRTVQPAVDYRITIETPEGTIVEDRTTPAEYVYDLTLEMYHDMGYAVQVGNDWRLYPEYLGEGYETENTDATLPPDVTMPTTAPTEAPEPSVPAETTPPGFSDFFNQYTDSNGNMYRIYRSVEPVLCTVELYYTAADYQNALDSWGNGTVSSPLAQWMYTKRIDAIGIFVGSMLVLLGLLTYLGFAAGCKPDSEEVRPSGLNRMPLDLYTALTLFVGFWLMFLLFDPVMGGLFNYYSKEWTEAVSLLIFAAVGLCAAISLICVLYWCALCAQVKADGFWWKRSLFGRFGGAIWVVTLKVLNGIWSFAGRIFRRVWGRILGITGKVGENVPSFTEVVRDAWQKLPLMWQWLAASAGIFALLALFGSVSYNGFGRFFYFVVVCFGFAMIIYVARDFGTLRDAAKRMSQGNLDVKINTNALSGGFLDFANDLNALSDACVHAAREQMKSERMKTELITNVSHDIKTPLTSIINYVDLLKKAETGEERAEYLEVLDRQSAQLKKLIEDLMEMSKASTGNVAVDLQPTDVSEIVNQALGEYADRFDKLGLNVVVRKPGENVIALCDGKLLWRVLSNVMSNIVKYTMPNTRVYLDLSLTEHRVILALKNISREELNISAEELMERFVRGDKSRNTEGNGLGLNIAKSLMEVQNGTLELVVDGDLFKVVLTLPRTENTELAEL